ncbi:MAG: LemA family protein [Geminicoccaceae bacterium]
MPGWVLWAGAALVLVLLYVWYASIVRRANRVREALGSIDVHLRQRHDLIPNLVKLAGHYMEHERGVLEEVTRLRSRVEGARAGDMGSAERFAAENQLAQATGRLLAQVEAYPQLKADTTVIEAQRGWAEAEAQITASRRFYNSAVTDLNNAVQVFPGSLLATIAGAKSMAYFETPPETREAPSVDDLLPSRAG